MIRRVSDLDGHVQSEKLAVMIGAVHDMYNFRVRKENILFSLYIIYFVYKVADIRGRVCYMFVTFQRESG